MTDVNFQVFDAVTTCDIHTTSECGCARQARRIFRTFLGLANVNIRHGRNFPSQTGHAVHLHPPYGSSYGSEHRHRQQELLLDVS